MSFLVCLWCCCGYYIVGFMFVGNFLSIVLSSGSGYVLLSVNIFFISLFMLLVVGFFIVMIVLIWLWSCLNNLVVFFCFFVSWDGWILFIMDNILVVESYMMVEESFNVVIGVLLLIVFVVVIFVSVVVVSVSVLIGVKSSLF